MDPIKRSPADALRSEVSKLTKSTNILVRSALGELPALLDAWVSSVEARLDAHQKLPPKAALAMLVMKPEPPPVGPRHYGKPPCEGCDE